ncbi:MAG: phenylalanine--tRNA ligase subunit alpha [bacterium]|nr:phenylalanine--tRNA ligase subunit alpha [bacterium]
MGDRQTGRYVFVELEDLKKQLAEIEHQAKSLAAEVTHAEALRQVKARILGKKGTLGKLMGTIRDYAPEVRGQVGQALNAANKSVGRLFDECANRFREKESAADSARAGAFDPTLPGDREMPGNVHPVTAVQWEIERVFERLGFTVEAGPDMETEHYNFEALNIPATHPARDMQDTFWLANDRLLRTHTSPVQIRTMEKFGPPIRCIVPGRCFRYETIDASHENTFHQCEGLMIDKDISIANLIAVMRLLLREVFQRDVKIRLRPGYFPFVEPGFELDMSCLICGGDGCATCKRSGWIEILPCGMVHPNVLRFGGIDPHVFTGFAFGLGLTRLAMMKYGIHDIRVMNSGDLRALVHPARLAGPTITGTLPLVIHGAETSGDAPGG